MGVDVLSCRRFQSSFCQNCNLSQRIDSLKRRLREPNLRTIPLSDVNARWNVWRRSDYFYPEMIPEPDYSDSEADEGESDDRHSGYDSEGDSRNAKRRVKLQTINKMEDEDRRYRRPPQTKEGEYYPKTRGDIPSRPKKGSDEELIKPKKPANPYLESTERQKLHKELKFNQKYGRQNGNKRTELQVALEKYTEGKIKKDLASRRSSLEQILEQQARKIEKQEEAGRLDERPAWIEHLQRQHFTKRTDPKTDEFYRVHAKVVSNLMNSNCQSSDGDQTSTDFSSGRSSSPSESSD
ncbi:uncharacterized protein TNCV_4942531 [Trichonephila clavipes]|nr:uncharacterized protein TNCV_4942531 [Trichonephila clavipes]